MILKFTPQGQKTAADFRWVKSLPVISAPSRRCAAPPISHSAPTDGLFISDGYGNARILEYTPMASASRHGAAPEPGQDSFRSRTGSPTRGPTLYVADRGNSRVQRFDLDGKYLGEWTNLGRPFALKVSGGALWVSRMLAKPTIFKVDLATGKILGQIEAPGPHSIDVSESGDVVASGCCGGSNPNGYSSWFRKAR